MSHCALALYWCDCGQRARLDCGRHARASLLAWKGESMRLISWNVNGLRAVMKKGFEDIVVEFDADVFALQRRSSRRAGDARSPPVPGVLELCREEGLLGDSGLHQARASSGAPRVGFGIPRYRGAHRRARVPRVLVRRCVHAERAKRARPHRASHGMGRCVPRLLQGA